MLTSAMAMPAPVGLWTAENYPWDAVAGVGGDAYNMAYTTGKVGQAFSLNGTNSYGFVADHPALDRPSITNALTLCAWVKWDGAQRPNYSPIASKWIGVYSHPWITYELFVLNDGSIGVGISDGSPSGQSASCVSDDQITVNAWHFVAVTYDGAELKIYIDGILVKTQAATVQIGDREGYLFIGSTSTFSGGNRFGGLIDELTLYDQALTLAEIRFKGGMNVRPTANAGPDQIVYLGSNTQGAVTLNGSGSNDPDNDPLTYTWSGSSISATGVSPTLTLPAGIYMVTLTVSDGYNQPSTSTVNIAVVPGVDAAAYSQMQDLVQSLTDQAEIDADTIDALMLKNTNLITLLQTLLPAFDQIKSAAETIIDISEQKRQDIDDALSAN